jgi:hypothetical protein
MQPEGGFRAPCFLAEAAKKESRKYLPQSWQFQTPQLPAAHQSKLNLRKV